MRGDDLVRILVVDSDAAQRCTIASALRDEGFRVWETADTSIALRIVHQSPGPMVVVVSAASSQVLQVAATDRRLVHLHAYILLQPRNAATTGECIWPHTYLKLWTLASPPDAQALLTAVMQAARTVGLVPVR